MEFASEIFCEFSLSGGWYRPIRFCTIGFCPFFPLIFFFSICSFDEIIGVDLQVPWSFLLFALYSWSFLRIFCFMPDSLFSSSKVFIWFFLIVSTSLLRCLFRPLFLECSPLPHCAWLHLCSKVFVVDLKHLFSQSWHGSIVSTFENWSDFLGFSMWIIIIFGCVLSTLNIMLWGAKCCLNQCFSTRGDFPW